MLRGRKFATILAYLTLEWAALFGVPVRLDQVEEMTRLLNQTRAAGVELRDQGSGDPPPDDEDDETES